MRAFVTGGRGFVGPWLCRHLAESGDEVVIADAALDITDADAVRDAVRDARPEVVYHLAARSSVSSSWDAPAATFTVNGLGTALLLSAVHGCWPAARVLLVSSVEVYGAVSPEDLPLRETAPFRPVTPYAASKAAAEMAGLQAHLGWGIKVIRARPFTHTGPGQTTQFFVPNMARQIVEASLTGATELRAGNLQVKRDILDVRDVVRAYRLLGAIGTPGEVYNICSGRSVSLGEVVRLMLARESSGLQITTDPLRVRPVDLPELRGDPGQLFRDTGWQPAYTLDQTLSDVLEYWRSRPSEPASLAAT